MPTLRQQMKDEMILVGLADSTQKRYMNAVTHLFNYYDLSPAKLTSEQIRNYLLSLKKRPFVKFL